jgi:DNA-binding NarL/FixJ family response regulator
MAHIIRVVIVEADAGLRDLMAAQLAIDGRFQVVGTSAGGDETIQVALSRAPDAIVLDYLCVNPLEVVPSLKQSLPELTLVCCSDRNGYLQDQALQLGADVFLSKSQSLTDDVISALLAANPDSEWI